MRILVTGCAGFIGSVVTTFGLLQKMDVYGVDDGSTASNLEDIKRVLGEKFYQGDAVTCPFTDIDVVIHLAAKTMVMESEVEKMSYLQGNVGLTMQLLDKYRGAGFVFASTSDVYSPGAVVGKESKIDPGSWYGKTKLACEDYVRHMASNAVVLRFMNVCGAVHANTKKFGHLMLGDQKFGEVLPIFAKRAIDGLPLEIYGGDYMTDDGTPERDFVHVLDVARAVIDSVKMVASGNSGTFVVGTGDTTSIKELAHMVASVAVSHKLPDVSISIVTGRGVDYGYMNSDPQAWVPGWAPRSVVIDCVQSTMQYMLAKRGKMPEAPKEIKRVILH